MSSQIISVKGNVRDRVGEALIGVTIVVENDKSHGTVTDMDGNFILNNVPANANLVFSYVGMSSLIEPVNGRNSINVTLNADNELLDEVVVVGYGTQKKANLTGSVVSVDLQELSKRKVGQTSMALQGIVPGLTVTQSSGQPGADGGTMRIRGITTLGENNPLILVDGVQMGINNIDPAMIESISVLKDAASAAIYGTRAANGVILITTKRAQADKFIVSYNGYMGVQQPTTLPKKVNAIDHMVMLSTAEKNAGTNPTFSDSYIQNYRDNMHSDPDAYPDVNWFDGVLTESGFSHNHFLTLSGGSERLRTIANIGYYDQEGLIPNTKFNRYTLRLNMDLEISKTVSAQIDAHLAMGNRNEPNQGVGSIIHYAFRTPAIFPMQFSNGNWGYAYNGLNARAMAVEGGLKRVENPSATLNFGLTYKPTDWLTFQGNYNPNYYATFTSSFSKAIPTYYADGSLAFTQPTNSSLTETTNVGLTNLLTATATASKSFNDNNFKFLLGYQQEDTNAKWHSGYREGFQFPQYTVLNAGSEEIQKANGSVSEIALRSYFGRLNYDFAGKYLLEANVRYDGTSRFAKSNRWGFFSSFSAGWRVSEEDFWEPFADKVNNFKVRASWGELGNQNVGGYYPSYQTISMDFLYVGNGMVIDGAGVSTLVNENLIWETTTMTGVGIDLGFGNKLDVVADYYYRKTHDILLRLDIPPTIGFGAPFQNSGVMENKGWARDEYVDNDYFPTQLYVREARRLNGEYIMTQNNCQGVEFVEDGIGMAAYGMDSHNCQRLVVNGMVKNEGDVQFHGFLPYHISYKSITPKREECSNLLVPVCVSSSHIAFGSIRMEPVFMVLGQSAGVAAAMAIDQNKSVQEIDVKKLRNLLKDDPYLDGSIPEILVDEGEIDKINRSGGWAKNYGGYKHSHMLTYNTQRDSYFTFNPIVKESGNYDVYFFCTNIADVADNFGIRVKDKDGEYLMHIQPKETMNAWTKIGTFNFEEGRDGLVTVDGSLSDGTIYADAVLLVPAQK